MSNPARSEEDITAGLMSLIAWAGNATAAARALKAEGKLDITPATLNSWAKERHVDRYLELQAKYQEQLESQMVHQFRNAARMAVEVQMQALERATERLHDNRDQEPSRTAANAATVADKMSAKVLAFTGRPTSIREDRNTEQILRSLMAKGVISLPDDQVQETGGRAGLGTPSDPTPGVES